MSMDTRCVVISVTLGGILIALIGVAGILLFDRSYPAPPIPERLATFRHLPERSRTLIDAIKRFHQDNGASPRTLGELVPKYLSAIPDTGVRRFPNYEYRVYEPREQGPVVWYNLGPAIAEIPGSPRRFAHFGAPDQAILLLVLAPDYSVLYPATVRLADNPGADPFDRGRWGAEKDCRMRMVASLLKDISSLGNRQKVVELLGEPDGEGVLRNTPWELSVPCSWRRWNSDRVIYWPTQAYESDPGWSFPIGDWLYMRGE
jgi:hypothetical protein